MSAGGGIAAPLVIVGGGGTSRAAAQLGQKTSGAATGMSFASNDVHEV